jgi:S-adenosylmethionine-diacylglycerol 3-amino-3-carboxypropyl transferase
MPSIEKNFKIPISFAQVREDPMIELSIIDQINGNINALIIGSGGCTLMSILSDKIDHIDVIDLNMAQLYLIELKLALFCNNLIDDRTINKILTSDHNEIDIYNNIRSKLSTPCCNFWDDHIALYLTGLNRNGIYEELFRLLSDTNFDFDRIFDKQFLSEIFGSAATGNSTKSFIDHFRSVFKYYEEHYDPSDNYFYHILLNNDKLPSINLPMYMTNRDNIRKNKDKIAFYNSDMLSFIKTSHNVPYDIIHTSNITDWMNLEEMNELIITSHKSLKLGGYVIMRRLIGNYDLKDSVSKYFEIVSEVPVDRSHFYEEVVIGKKIN